MRYAYFNHTNVEQLYLYKSCVSSRLHVQLLMVLLLQGLPLLLLPGVPLLMVLLIENLLLLLMRATPASSCCSYQAITATTAIHVQLLLVHFKILLLVLLHIQTPGSSAASQHNSYVAALCAC